MRRQGSRAHICSLPGVGGGPSVEHAAFPQLSSTAASLLAQRQAKERSGQGGGEGNGSAQGDYFGLERGCGGFSGPDRPTLQRIVAAAKVLLLTQRSSTLPFPAFDNKPYHISSTVQYSSIPFFVSKNI